MTTRKRSKKPDDWRRLRHFESENEQLRKEVTKLRKIVNTTVIDTLEEKAKRVNKGEPAIVKELCCERCGNPTIDIVPINRPDGKFKVEICKSCQHRSILKPVV